MGCPVARLAQPRPKTFGINENGAILVASSTRRGPSLGSPGGKSRCGSRGNQIDPAHVPLHLISGTRRSALARPVSNEPPRLSHVASPCTAFPPSSMRTDARRFCSTMARQRRKRRYSRVQLRRRTQRWRFSWQRTTSPNCAKGVYVRALPPSPTNGSHSPRSSRLSSLGPSPPHASASFQATPIANPVNGATLDYARFTRLLHFAGEAIFLISTFCC